MRWYFTVALSVAAVGAASAESRASGGLFRSCGGTVVVAEPCAPASVTPSSSGPCAAPCDSGSVQYVEKVVTRYRQVMVEKEVVEVVCKRVAREEKFVYDVQVPKTYAEKRKVTENKVISKDVEFTYTVVVPVTVAEKRKQTVYKTITKEVEHTYTVSVPVTVPEKRSETFYTTVSKEVEYTYTVSVPKTLQKVVQQTCYQTVTEQVTECVNVCKTVMVNYVDACGVCRCKCERIVVQEPVTRCIVKHVPVTTDVVVNYTVCETETRVGKKTVSELVSAVREVTVNVTKYESQTRVGKKTVSEVVPVEQEITVNVCREEKQTRVGKKTVSEIVPVEREITVNITKYETEKREGSRTVYDTVEERVVRKVQVCELVPYEEVIRVPVATSTPCESYGATYASPSYSSGCAPSSQPRVLGGLLNRLRCR